MFVIVHLLHLTINTGCVSSTMIFQPWVAILRWTALPLSVSLVPTDCHISLTCDWWLLIWLIHFKSEILSIFLNQTVGKYIHLQDCELPHLFLVLSYTPVLSSIDWQPNGLSSLLPNSISLAWLIGFFM